jgi:tetratricopeptide (TPR) repeat protein
MPAVAKETSVEELNAQVRKLAQDGRLGEAADLAEQALREAEATFGPSDPRVAPFLGLVAGVYMDQSRHSEAGALLARVPWMWNTIHEEAVALFRTRRYAAGLKVAQEAFRLAEDAFGSEAKFAEYTPASITPSVQKIAGYTATSMNTLALLYEAEGQHDQAEAFYQRAVRLREMVFGPDHFEVVAPLANLALMYDAQGRYTEAGQVYDRLLAIYEDTQGPDHPHILKLLEKYAEVLKKTDRAEEAQALEARAAQIRAKRQP